MQEPFKYSQHEVIWLSDFRFHVSSTSVDSLTWQRAYEFGYREPNYPVPAIREGFEFGLQLPGKVVILHWVQGAYDATGTD